MSLLSEVGVFSEEGLSLVLYLELAGIMGVGVHGVKHAPARPGFMTDPWRSPVDGTTILMRSANPLLPPRTESPADAVHGILGCNGPDFQILQVLGRLGRMPVLGGEDLVRCEDVGPREDGSLQVGAAEANSLLVGSPWAWKEDLWLWTLPWPRATPHSRGNIARQPNCRFSACRPTLVGRMMGQGQTRTERGERMTVRRLARIGGIGFAGGSLGAFLAEATINIQIPLSPLISNLLGVSIWAAIFAAILSCVLTWALAPRGGRSGIPWRAFRRAAPVGALAGLLAGGSAQLVYSVPMNSIALREYAFRPLCWGIVGALLGWRLSSVIPNLGQRRGLVAGGAGGAVGGYAFILVCSFLPHILGRVVGIGALGAALGLTVLVADSLFREAILEVAWTPKERITFTLGPKPVYIGGGDDDHIYLRGLPRHAASVLLEQGKVEYRDGATGQRTELRDGRRLKIGQVEMVVRARA